MQAKLIKAVFKLYSQIQKKWINKYALQYKMTTKQYVNWLRSWKTNTPDHINVFNATLWLFSIIYKHIYELIWPCVLNCPFSGQ